MKVRKKALTLLLIIFFIAPLSSQRLKKIDFRDKPIQDILLGLANVSGKSIIVDDTVIGNASWHFEDMEFDAALSAFLNAQRLYLSIEGPVYRVSRIGVMHDPSSDSFTVDADDVDASQFLRTLSREMGRTIVFDSLPRIPVTIHEKAVKPDRIVQIALMKLPDYKVVRDGEVIIVKRVPPESTTIGTQMSQPSTPGSVKSTGGLYTIDADKLRLADVVKDLFKAAHKEYTLLFKADQMLDSVHYANKDFETILRLILQQCNADFEIADDVTYIFEIQRRDVVRNLKETRIVELSNITAQDAISLLPQDMAAGGFHKADKSGNAVILTGSAIEISMIESFLKAADLRAKPKESYRYDLKYLKVKDIIQLAQANFPSLQIQTIPGAETLVVRGSDNSRKAFSEWLSTNDTQDASRPIRLKYIKTEDLLKNPPPSVSKEDIRDAGNGNTIFFLGSLERRDLFIKDLELIDRPKPQVKYQLLVIQYQKSDSLNWTKSLSTNPIAYDSAASIVAVLSNLVSLNFNVLSAFGYAFAVKLNAELGDGLAKVWADTTLNGLSGQDIQFRNTNTYRYRDMVYDSDTGKTKSTGVTREIASGLIIGINGWVSGDGLITMDVNATVSKQGTDTSSENNPPPTSEKVVTTHVRSPSGVPIVISGLSQKDETTTIKKWPILGDIPLIGILFQDKVKSVEETEMAIYIIPYIESFNDTNEGAQVKMSEIWERYGKKILGVPE